MYIILALNRRKRYMLMFNVNSNTAQFNDVVVVILCIRFDNGRYGRSVRVQKGEHNICAAKITINDKVIRHRIPSGKWGKLKKSALITTQFVSD